MWDRIKVAAHSTGGQVGHPLDDDRMRVGLGLNYGLNAATGYSYSIKGGPAPQRSPREIFESRYEIAPAIPDPPRRNPSRITVRTNFCTTSSAYSQDSHPVKKYTAKLATRYGYRYGGADEISPPSSPEPDAAADRFLPGDVSPIDEDDGPTRPRYGIPNTDHLQMQYGRPDGAYVQQQGRGTHDPLETRGQMSIPTMRRERRRQSDAANRVPNPTQRAPAPQHPRNPPAREATRWHPLTGEQTTSTQGRPSQLNPAESGQQGLGITARAWSSPQHSPTTAPPSFGDRVRRIAKKAAAAREGSTDPAAGAFTSSRPGWRGASGRTAIVDPVHDTREVPPLKIPEKSSRRNLPPGVGSKPNNTPDGPARRGQTPPISPPPSETPTRSGPREARRRIQPNSQQQPATTQTPTQGGQRYASPPLSADPGADAPTVAARELARDHHGGGLHALPSPATNAHSPELANVIRRKPPVLLTNHHHQVSVSSVYSQDGIQSSPLQIPGTARPAVVPEEPYVPPPSRFSITTYATSHTGTTHDDDTVDGNQPPVPSLPADYQERFQPQARPASSDHSPVTSPIDQFMTSPFASDARAASTSPTPPATMQPAIHPAVARAQAQAQDRPSSRASITPSEIDMNKSLPPPPPEQSADQAQDRVGLLNAQLRSLANRRININRSIKQMTELMPTDNVLNSDEVKRKREIEKQKVEMLRQELADVQREEYELGLKLHRAYKRLDRDGEWEATTLWVRRVTG
ncbi:hypothetical protein VTI74DRAFT_2551 [Chaetomium olivicolor]